MSHCKGPPRLLLDITPSVPANRIKRAPRVAVVPPRPPTKLAVGGVAAVKTTPTSVVAAMKAAGRIKPTAPPKVPVPTVPKKATVVTLQTQKVPKKAPPQNPLRVSPKTLLATVAADAKAFRSTSWTHDNVLSLGKAILSGALTVKDLDVLPSNWKQHILATSNIGF